MKAVAQSLDVAVNKFVETPVGMLVAGLSIWYVAGDGISGMFESIWMILVSIAFLLTVPRTLRYHMKQNQLTGYEQKEVKTIFNGTKIINVPKYRPFNEHNDGGYVFFEIIAYIVGFVALILVV